MWISTADRLPDRDDRYIVHVPTADPAMPYVVVAWFDPEEGMWSLLPVQFLKNVAHWMEMPRPPSESRK